MRTCSTGTVRLAADRLPEAVRNDLLRRVDWRFLLPAVTVRSTIAFADGRLGDAVRAFFDATVAGAAPSRGVFDLAVLADARAGQVRAAWDALRPGGVCYCEWRSPRLGGVNRVRRELHAAGFANVRCYWPWPLSHRRTPLFWVPLSAPRTLRHLLEVGPTGYSRWRRLRRGLLYAAWRLALWLRVSFPVCAIATKAVSRNADAFADHAREPEVAERIRSGWVEWGLGERPKDLSCALLAPGKRSTNKVIALVFADSGREPAMVVKIARVREAGRALEREAANLEAVHAAHPGLGAPHPLFVGEHAGCVALGETALPGRPLWTLLRRASYPCLAYAVTDWLTGLALDRDPASPELWRRLAEPVLRDFERSYGSECSRTDLGRTHDALRTVGHLPLVVEHRDCSPWNVLVSKCGRIAASDWESSEPEGLPGLDLIYFLTYLSFFHDDAIRRGRIHESYGWTLDPTTVTGRVVATCQERYASGLGFDAAVFRALRLLVWPLHAASARTRAAVAEPVSESLDAHVFVSLWREELRHAEA